jgi:glutathione synthase/RimK-type ligase-like ATP-grasp enzyme
MARHAGLATPLTLIGNDPSDIVEFAELADGPVVCKTLSSIVLADNGQHKITYTTLIDPHSIDHDAFAATAHLLQAWVPKAREVRATDTFELNYGGFDFVITPDEEWIMLECNPSAQWLWLHHTAGLPIPAALADLLTTAEDPA